MAEAIERVRARDLADWLLAHGRTSITTEDAAALLGIHADQVRARLRVPSRRGEIVSPSRGLWIPVPPQFRTWRAPPAMHVVDDWMRHLRRDYYVGWLSAAEIHGAAHQRPQVFQVAVDSDVSNRMVGRTRFEFLIRARVTELPRDRREVPTGYAWVSTPELTVLDLCDDPARGAGLSNLATVLAELAEDDRINVSELARVSAMFPAAAGRRAGWLLTLVAPGLETGPLADAVANRVSVPSPLSPSRPDRGITDTRWHVRVNTEVEPDL